jgi:hypothetical protein
VATPTSTGSGVLTCLQHVGGTRVAIASCSDVAYNVNEAGGHPIKSPATPSLHRHRQSYSVNLQPTVFRGAPPPLIFASRRPRNICLQTTILTHANDEMPFLQCDYYCMTYELLISEVLYIFTDFSLIPIIFADRPCLIFHFALSSFHRQNVLWSPT